MVEKPNSQYWLQLWKDTQDKISTLTPDMDLKRAKNDKDEVEYLDDRLSQLIQLASYYYKMYEVTLAEENGGKPVGYYGLDYLGRSDYGY